MSDRRYKIAVLPGDGTGPEVVREGLKSLEAAAKATGFSYDLEHYDLGGGNGRRQLRAGHRSSVCALSGPTEMVLIGTPTTCSSASQ